MAFFHNTPPPPKTRRISSVAGTPDGSVVIVGRGDGVVEVWDGQSGCKVHDLGRHENEVARVRVSPDGRHAASLSWPSQLKIWDTRTGEVGSFDGRTMAATPDGRGIVLWQGERLIVCGFDDGKLLHEQDAPRDWIPGPWFSIDDRVVLTRDQDGAIQAWDIDRTQVVFCSHLDAQKWQPDLPRRPFTPLVNENFVWAVGPKGGRVVLGRGDGELSVWDLREGIEVQRLEVTHKKIRTVAMSPDGKRIVAGASDSSLVVWDLESGTRLGTPRSGRGPFAWVTCAAFTPDGAYVLSGGHDARLEAWQIETGALAACFPTDSEVLCVDGRKSLFALGTELGHLYLLRPERFCAPGELCPL